jgi:hypothetical protein
VKIYFLVGLVACALAVAFLILDIKTYVDYANWLVLCKNPACDEPSNLTNLYAIWSVGFASVGITLLIIHFKKWYETPKITN